MRVCVCVFDRVGGWGGRVAEAKKAVYLRPFIQRSESRCLNNPLSDYVNVPHANGKLRRFVRSHEKHHRRRVGTRVRIRYTHTDTCRTVKSSPVFSNVAAAIWTISGA